MEQAKFLSLLSILCLVYAFFPQQESFQIYKLNVLRVKADTRIKERFAQWLGKELSFQLYGMNSFDFCVISAICGVLASGVGFAFNNIVIGIICLLGGLLLPFKIIQELKSHRQKRINKQLETVLHQIASLFKISQSIELSFYEATKSMKSPLKEEFWRFNNDINKAGMPLEEALDRLVLKLNNGDFKFFANLALMSQKYGGESKDLMLQVPQTLRERYLARAELEAEVAGAKQQAWFLFLGTPLFLTFFYFARKDFVLILTNTSIGKIGMSIVALFSVISIFLIEKITEPIQ